MKKIDILFIDPPMKRYNDETFLYGNLYQSDDTNSKVFNPGLLSIASYVLEHGYTVEVIHIRDEDKIEELLLEASQNMNPATIAVSCSYMHTYLPTIEISKQARKLFPQALLVAGGQHIGDIAGFALRETEFDIIIQGEGESVVKKLLEYKQGLLALDEIGNIYIHDEFAKCNQVLDSENFTRFEICDFSSNSTQYRYVPQDLLKSKNMEPLVPLDDMPFLHYELYKDYIEYPPYLEESRGCYGNCKYCVSATCNTYRYKTARRFLDELEYVVNIYGKDIVYPFTAANLGVNVDNTIKIFEGIIEKFGSLKWVAEFRLDLNWEKYIDLMYKSGCVSYGIGLESANEDILKIMKKTANPSSYLKNAEKLIEKVRTFTDSYLHLNLMFYIGENPKSMADNMGFISKYFEDISIVHYSPLILYSGTKAWNEFDQYHEQYGTTIVKTPIYDAMHAYPVNVSRLYTYKDGCHFSRIIEKMFIETEGYMVNHETRVTRTKSGEITDDAKKAYIKRMLDN